MSYKKTKKPNIMSLSIDVDMQELLKRVARRRNVSVSQLIRELVESNLSKTDEEVATVVWKVPLNLRESEQDLRVWFQSRTEGVIKAIVKK